MARFTTIYVSYYLKICNSNCLYHSSFLYKKQALNETRSFSVCCNYTYCGKAIKSHGQFQIQLCNFAKKPHKMNKLYCVSCYYIHFS